MVCPVEESVACFQSPLPTLYFTNTQAASQLKGAEVEVRQELSQERLNCTSTVCALVFRPVREILDTLILLAKREDAIHSKELSRRVLMWVLGNMNK
jgi:hypothetical protein